MELLLLLTALFASLTGTGAGERSLRQVQGVAVVQAAQAVEAAAHPSRATIPMPAAPHPAQTRRIAWPAAEAAPLPATHLPFERRLE